MFFTEQERKIYTAPNGNKYDPVLLDRMLTIESGNRLNGLISDRNATSDGLGDVSSEGKRLAIINAAKAEIELGRIAIKAFNLPPFPDTTLATALEILYDFLGWMEGKGETAGKPQSSPQTSPDQSELQTTMSS